MASRNQYTYTPGYGVGNRQNSPRNAYRPNAHPGVPRRPDAPTSKQRPVGDTAILTLLFIIAPLCGILGVFFSGFLWVFIGVGVLVLAGMWALRCFEPRGRAFVSGVLMVLIAVALIAVIDFSKGDGQFQTYGGGGDPVIGDSQGVNGQNASQGSGLGFVGLTNNDPSPTPPLDTQTGGDSGQVGLVVTPTAAPQNSYLGDGVSVFVSEAEHVLDNYLKMWAQQNFEDMVQYTTPSWRAAQSVPQRQLSWNHSGWLLNSWTISSGTQSSSADSATFTVVADLTKNTSARTSVNNQYSAIVFNVDGTWYVDPDSLRNGIAVIPDPTPAAGGQEGAQAPVNADPTTSPSLKLWYNSNGGSYYHLNEKCADINQKFYKDMAAFTYIQVNDSTYAKLRPCSTCNAPKR